MCSREVIAWNESRIDKLERRQVKFDITIMASVYVCVLRLHLDQLPIFGHKEHLITSKLTSLPGKFILYANIPYRYPPTPNPSNKLGEPWGIGGFGGGMHM